MKIAIAQADVPNLIGNVYTEEAISKMYEKAKDAIENGFFGGELIRDGFDRAYGEATDLSRATHQITNVDIIDNFLVADVSFIGTKDGELAKNLVLTAAGVLRPTVLGRLDSITREIDIDNVISFDVIQYHEDFRLYVTWKQIK